jgi:hypothetical protein
MAKKTMKSVEKKTVSPAKKSAAVTKPKAPAVPLIVKACDDALKKLRALDIELGLQADIEWCLGSYRNDKNPIGLYEMIEKAIPVFKAEAEKNSKAVPAKLLTDLAKALKSK